MAEPVIVRAFDYSTHTDAGTIESVSVNMSSPMGCVRVERRMWSSELVRFAEEHVYVPVASLDYVIEELTKIRDAKTAPAPVTTA